MDEIEIIEYNASWLLLFAEEKQRLQTTLNSTEIVTIEHVGSTAIPGMAAKPVIDIIMTVKSLEVAGANFIAPLQSLDYVFWPENPKLTELYFVKGMPPYGAKRTHHLRISEENDDVRKKRFFRDWLITHPEEAKRYAVLKKELAIQFSKDREAYTDAKTSFVNDILLSY
jgi:GrpB-like predicted nucleotidyltransferase (UPF0157 family)